MNYLPYQPGAKAVAPWLPLVLIGCGPGSFIGPTAWNFNIPSSLFSIEGYAPSRDEAKTNDFARTLDQLELVQEPKVDSDYEALVSAMLGKHEELVVAVAVETPHHAAVILKLIELGVKYIICDKPFTASMPQCEEVLAAAKAADAHIFLTFNHRQCEPIFALQELVTRHAGEITGFEAGFRQDWILNPPDIRQLWRLQGGTAESPVFSALTDIGSHAADLASFVLGADLTVVSATMGKGGHHNYHALDFGSADVKAGEIPGKIVFTQVEPGFADDIYMVVRTGEKAIKWSMEGAIDGLFVGPATAALDDIAAWGRPQQRGHGAIWKTLERAGGVLSKNPPGHIQGWDLMWFYTFAAVAGHIAKLRGLENWEDLPACMRLPVATAAVDGLRSERWMCDVIKAAGYQV